MHRSGGVLCAARLQETTMKSSIAGCLAFAGAMAHAATTIVLAPGPGTDYLACSCGGQVLTSTRSEGTVTNTACIDGGVCATTTVVP
jgi:hypothetical protein